MGKQIVETVVKMVGKLGRLVEEEVTMVEKIVRERMTGVTGCLITNSDKYRDCGRQVRDCGGQECVHCGEQLTKIW